MYVKYLICTIVLLLVSNIWKFPVWATDYQVCLVSSYFSPTEDVEQVLDNELSTAQSSVQAALYGITNEILTNRLIQLHNKGVKIEVHLDKLQSKGRYSRVNQLIEAGVPVYIKRTHALQHNKFVVVDHKKVLMGSWNWSESANKQDNSLIKIQECIGQVGEYILEFERMKTRDGKF